MRRPSVMLTSGEARATTLVGGPITSNTTWSLANSPYEVTSSITVSNTAKLTIEAGVVVRFRTGTGLMVGKIIGDLCELDCQEIGRLDVLGTVQKPVLFTSKSGLIGDWRGVGFGPATDAGSIFSTLKNLVIDRAGQSLKYGGTVGLVNAGLSFVKTGNNFVVDSVTVQNSSADGWVLREASLSLNKVTSNANGAVGMRVADSQLTLTKSKLSNNALGGISLRDTVGLISGNQVLGNSQWGMTSEDSDPELAAELVIASNKLENNSGYGLRCNLSSPPALGVNTVQNNNNPGVLLVGATLPGSFTIVRQLGDANFDVYSASIHVKPGEVLEIEAGLQLRFAPHTGLELDQGNPPATLLAVGSEQEPIVLTALTGTPGGWLGLTVRTSRVNGVSWLQHVVVDNAGELNALGARKGIALSSGGPLMTWVDVTVSNSLGDGLLLAESEVLVFGGSYSNNLGSGIKLDSGPSPELLDVEIVGNAGAGISGEFFHGLVRGCDISHNGEAGIDVRHLGGTVELNTISFNGGYGLRFQPTFRIEDVRDNFLEGNGQPGIELLTSLGAGLMNQGAPVLSAQQGESMMTFDSNVQVVGDPGLHVEAGVELRFLAGNGLQAGHQSLPGTVSLEGTAEKPVILTAANGQSGGWLGVALGPFVFSGTSSRLDYVVIDKAGGNSVLSGVAPFRAGLALHGSSAVINNLTVANSAGDGVLSVGGSPTIRNAAIAFNSGAGVRFVGPQFPSFSKALLFSNGPNIGLSPGSTVLAADPLFTNAAQGDFTPQPDSPLIDAGLVGSLAFFGAAPELGGVEAQP